jgi:Phytanoyl-CoA dioxygenase (PhyH)
VPLTRSLATTRPVGRLVLAPLAKAGYRRYRRTDSTPHSSYLAMRKLFAADPKAFAALVADAQHEHALLEGLRADSGIAAGAIGVLVDTLRRDGIAVFPTPLPPDDCAALEHVARSHECRLTGAVAAAPARARFDEVHPMAVRFDLDEHDIVSSSIVQQLIADESLLALAQSYLGAPPLQDMVAMWWSAAVSGSASSEAAQCYHFDLDRLRFLKVFVYLTDVDASTGPHEYVRGSHRDLPSAFRLDRRYGDDEVLATMADGVVSVTGPRGTMFAADTRGLHKGVPLVRGHRLIFQLEFTTSFFGQDVNRVRLKQPTPALADVLRRYPSSYRRFIVDD